MNWSTEKPDWSEPIPIENEEEICAVNECIECLSCEYFYAFDEPYPTEYPCSTRKFIASYRNPTNENLLIYNVCASRTGLRENGGRAVRYIIHGAEQSDGGAEAPFEFKETGSNGGKVTNLKFKDKIFLPKIFGLFNEVRDF